MKFLTTFFLLSLLLSPIAYSADIEWRWFSGVSASSLRNQVAPSPAALCEKARAYYSSGGGGGYLYNSSVHSLISTTISSGLPAYSCTIKRMDSGALFSPFIMSITDNCPQGTIYDYERNICSSDDPCESTIGSIVYHEFAFATIGDDSNPSTDPPVTVCKNSCQYSHTYDGFTVKAKRDFTPPDNILGSFKYKGNGISCTPSANDPSAFDQPPSKEPIDTPAEYTSENKCDDWVTTPDGTLMRSCKSKEVFNEPGTLDCTGMTAAHCKPGKPAPEYSKTDKTEETKKQTNADGSTTTETSTTTDKTTCKGAKPCTSTTANEKETTGTNADGTPGDQQKECTGTGCKPGDKDKDGETDDEKEEEGEERTAATGACDASISCSGDAIDCAVLQEEKAQRCLAEENSDYEKHKNKVDSQLTDDKYQTDKETVEVPSLLQGASRFLPASCPPSKTINLKGARSVSFDYGPFCSFASGLAPVIVAIALLFSAMYVGRSFGG